MSPSVARSGRKARRNAELTVDRITYPDGITVLHASFLETADPRRVRREMSAWLDEVLGEQESTAPLALAPGAPLVEEPA